MDNLNDLTEIIIGCAIEVHKTLGGPGLLESVYEECLAWELSAKKIAVKRQVLLPITYKNVKLGNPYRVDLIIDDKVIVECKAVSQYNKLFESQVLTYLRLSKLKLGLVINFGEALLKKGIHRVINGFF
ncbi:MAG: GxxExxY protein [Deltaproteobacteria bacterium]|nr:GxxExxY protein [Deltaproteobacteria bacterium]